ncbi:hypothetical protein F6A13_08125 [Acidithiobacillus sp. 'AMD consortium']|jgi:phosphohistidine phosphatase|uniref:Uncharacterized protein n=2 Tax=Acidithiobacillus ferridurans TaxID=1232575 RepID=A0A2Z6IMC8_ACIFI|nr:MULTISPECIES: histidine phosphatase family protein [Acidithiobacillus]MBU2715180.1 hypothetical protein [Acidithiobacillus ferridurans]MBU2719611.1 hypothetical protein [Acidithiobacillus ferridurans]MBU2723320.1 hypothetical protein [Acidithiobacillus ferridurans]MBU2727499.1 hypothetical protein [Acidithiobacillus ferridurans]MBU2805701.1 hypothetical protein [Acidithiobacillus ferridurans]
MDLLFLRHAEAEDADNGGSDFERQLTAHGRASAEETADGLALCICNQIALRRSPLVRTREMGAYLAAALLPSLAWR